MDDAVRTALKAAFEALNVWTCVHASDSVSEADLAESYRHISDHGGTLGLIADVQAAIERALSQSPA